MQIVIDRVVHPFNRLQVQRLIDSALILSLIFLLKKGKEV